jgi:hypothetical protein
MLRKLQDRPHILELVYQWAYRLLLPFQGWLKPGSFAETLFVQIERLSKGAVFDCRMCGQCVLHDTGMTCPMTCPKNLRNGPCGGVRLNGNCEILPDKPCVWMQAWERSQQMPVFGIHFVQIQPPLNHHLKNTSAWINELHLKGQMLPRAWEK